MEFDSPDVEKDFPGLLESGSKKKEESDFSEGDHEKVSKKELLIGRRKDKKDKKDRGYAALEGESSPEDEIETKSPSKSIKKSKAFKFSTKSKEKREKSREKEKLDKEPKDKEISESKEKKKDKEKKEKDKREKKDKDKEKDKKDKKSKQYVCEEVLELGDVQPVFGVSVSLATERSRCHDGVDIPLVVRDCIDYLQEHALQNDQIYKVEPLKTRLQHLKRLYNNRESQGTNELDTPSACGLLKLFLKELPEPVLTTDLIARFEEAASQSQVTQQEPELRSLVDQLPSCNKTLLSWILLHFDSVIQNERNNKVNAQSLAMLLSSTLQMSHRLLVKLLSHATILFNNIQIVKYVPPITSSSPKLPETRNEIQVELRKQESLLAQIHAEMNAGFVSKKREEQLWEVQRIITQLKRKLRTFEKKQDSVVKSGEEAMESEIVTDTEVTKPGYGALSESGMNTERKHTPQENPDIPIIIPEEQSIETDPDRMFIHESGLLMLPDTHPEYTNLIRLQFENMELNQWKNNLASRISAERAEILRLKKLITLAESQQQVKCGKSLNLNPETGDYERIVEHYIKENALLENKRTMLAKEIFEENRELIQLQVDLAMQSLKV